MENNYYIYILRCHDNSLYTGITTDVKRRFLEHKNKTTLGAKYTHSKDVIKIECIWKTNSRSYASKLEYHLKKLKKQTKEELLTNSCSIDNLFDFDTSVYQKIDYSSIFTL